MKKLVVFFAILIMVAVATTAIAQDYPELYAEVKCKRLSVREEPDEDSKRLAMAENGQTLTLVQDRHGLPQRENGFIKVLETESWEEGWVLERLVKTNPQHLVIAGKGIVAYSSYTMKEDMTDAMDLGSEHLILEDLEDFWVIEFREGGSAWVAKTENAYIREDAERYLERSGKKVFARCKTQAYALPDTDSYVVDKFAKGDTLRVVAKNDTWYVVKLGERHAYVLRSEWSNI